MPPDDDASEPADGHEHAGHEHIGHEHAAHRHGDHDHAASADEPSDDEPDISGWAASAARAVCPACGAAGALSLGGGLFCPACGETSTNPGYSAPDPAS